MEQTEPKDIVLKEALINAYKYKTANAKIVFQKLMAKYPPLRSKAKELKPIVETIVKEVNSYTYDKIRAIVEEKYSDEIQEKVVEKKIIPDIPGAIKGKVKVRYPPEPSKHPHIGQMLSFCINHLIAEKYEGKRVLRFDDTNPETAKLEFYDSFREAIEWMGLPIDEEVIASNYMKVYYEKAKELIKNNDAYVCFCNREEMKKLREEEKPCKCNLTHTVDQNLEFFEKMLKGDYGPGEAVLRLRGDMKSTNTALRDPVLMRISTTPHCIQGDKYVVWPMYDFESPIMEHITGVTHVLRSIEFGKMREELQIYIAKKLSLNVPYFYEYSRFNIIGAPTQGRIIRQLVEEGIVEGWDDLRLVTYQALRKRGIQPQVFIELIKRVGMTKSSTNIDWSLISSINRKIIEPKSKHFFFVDDPIQINILNAEPITLTLPSHPHNKELGYRTIVVNDKVFVSGSDEIYVKHGSKLRLKDLYNIVILEKLSEKEFNAEITDKKLVGNVPKLQWVPDEHVHVEVKKPEMLYLNNNVNKGSLKYIRGIGEKNILSLKIGEIAQFERFGYVKLNEKNDLIKMNYVHG